MRLKPLEIVAPSHWASFLINGDDSGLEPDEYRALTAFLARQNAGLPVSCEDAGFCKWHDALPELDGKAADCQTYIFLVPADE